MVGSKLAPMRPSLARGFQATGVSRSFPWSTTKPLIAFSVGRAFFCSSSSSSSSPTTASYAFESQLHQLATSATTSYVVTHRAQVAQDRQLLDAEMFRPPMPVFRGSDLDKPFVETNLFPSAFADRDDVMRQAQSHLGSHTGDLFIKNLSGVGKTATLVAIGRSRWSVYILCPNLEKPDSRPDIACNTLFARIYREHFSKRTVDARSDFLERIGNLIQLHYLARLLFLNSCARLGCQPAEFMEFQCNGGSQVVDEIFEFLMAHPPPSNSIDAIMAAQWKENKPLFLIDEIQRAIKPTMNWKLPADRIPVVHARFVVCGTSLTDFDIAEYNRVQKGADSIAKQAQVLASYPLFLTPTDTKNILETYLNLEGVDPKTVDELAYVLQGRTRTVFSFLSLVHWRRAVAQSGQLKPTKTELLNQALDAAEKEAVRHVTVWKSNNEMDAEMVSFLAELRKCRLMEDGYRFVVTLPPKLRPENCNFAFPIDPKKAKGSLVLRYGAAGDKPTVVALWEPLFAQALDEVIPEEPKRKVLTGSEQGGEFQTAVRLCFPKLVSGILAKHPTQLPVEATKPNNTANMYSFAPPLDPLRVSNYLEAYDQDQVSSLLSLMKVAGSKTTQLKALQAKFKKQKLLTPAALSEMEQDIGVFWEDPEVQAYASMYYDIFKDGAASRGELVFFLEAPTQTILIPTDRLGPDAVMFYQVENGGKVLCTLAAGLKADHDDEKWIKNLKTTCVANVFPVRLLLGVVQSLSIQSSQTGNLRRLLQRILKLVSPSIVATLGAAVTASAKPDKRFPQITPVLFSMASLPTSPAPWPRLNIKEGKQMMEIPLSSPEWLPIPADKQIFAAFSESSLTSNYFFKEAIDCLKAKQTSTSARITDQLTKSGQQRGALRKPQGRAKKTKKPLTI